MNGIFLMKYTFMRPYNPMCHMNNMIILKKKHKITLIILVFK